MQADAVEGITFLRSKQVLTEEEKKELKNQEDFLSEVEHELRLVPDCELAAAKESIANGKGSKAHKRGSASVVRA